MPLNNRCPDVTVYRADTIDVTPTRPEHVLLVVEVVSPGSETTDRIVKADQYARVGIPFYWRVEQAATGAPVARPGRVLVFADSERWKRPGIAEVEWNILNFGGVR